MQKRKHIYHWAIATIAFVAIAVLFIMIPVPSANLYLRVHFDEIAWDKCALYYSTTSSNSFTQEQCIISEVDFDKKQVTFCLDGTLSNQLTGLRLDFSNNEDLICIKSVTVSSAGIIQKEFDPITFFGEENVSHTNAAEITLVKPTERAYILTEANDPFIILSESLVAEIADCFSSFRLSRLAICLFVAGCYIMYKRK